MLFCSTTDDPYRFAVTRGYTEVKIWEEKRTLLNSTVLHLKTKCVHCMTILLYTSIQYCSKLLLSMQASFAITKSC